MKELPKPGDLGDRVGDGAVFRLCTGTRDSVLVFGGPRHQVVPEENSVARSGATSVGAASPISIKVDDEVVGRGPLNV
jgi:hypothetical protein